MSVSEYLTIHPEVAEALAAGRPVVALESTVIAHGLPRIVAAETARAGGGRTLWLTAWERNPRAQAFYAKAGFRDVGTDTFVLGHSPQVDRVLVRALD